MWSKDPPFMLFVLVDVSTDQLNKILEAAFKGSEFSRDPFWLPPSDDYSDAPKKKSGEVSPGTGPPISSYKSPFIGKKGEDLAAWLENMPKEVDVDSHFFAILDRSSAEEGLIVVGRRGGYNLEDPDNLEFIRLDVRFGAALIYGGSLGLWEDVRAGTRQEDLDSIKY